jgi:hypothetical protein
VGGAAVGGVIAGGRVVVEVGEVRVRISRLPGFHIVGGSRGGG